MPTQGQYFRVIFIRGQNRLWIRTLGRNEADVRRRLRDICQKHGIQLSTIVAVEAESKV